MKLTEVVEGMYELLKRRAEEGDLEAYELVSRAEGKRPEMIKPCPFCGGKAYPYKDDEQWIYIVCSKCSSETDGCDTLETAVSNWNQRTAEHAKCPNCGAEMTAEDTEA